MVLEYGKAFLLGGLQSPFIYLQGLMVYFFIKKSEKFPSYEFLWNKFLICITAMSLTLYLLLGTLVKWTRDVFSSTPYIFLLYLLVFCLVYEAVLFVGRKSSIPKWNPTYFVLFFVPITGIFYNVEVFGASFGESLFFILGQCFGLLLFTRITLSLYHHVIKRYYGPSLLKNPVMVVFLAFFFGELLYLLQLFSAHLH